MGNNLPARRSSLIRNVASRAMSSPASVASRKASALAALNRPLIAIERAYLGAFQISVIAKIMIVLTMLES